MKPKHPLPAGQPFLTILTHTYRRPVALAANMASIGSQTLVAEVEHLVVPDYLGVSPADAVYGRMPWYADAARGEYVHVLGDDDRLADRWVVEKLKKALRAWANPAWVLVTAEKGGTRYPKRPLDEPLVEGDIDLCCSVLRADLWRAFAHSYGHAYRCDWDGYLALVQLTGHEPLRYGLLFAVGAEGGGRPEAVAW